jgi:hypothetical protein
VPGGQGAVKDPIHAKVGYERRLYSRDEAVRAALLDTLHAAKPPAVLFTASHGMAIKSGRPNQVTDNGGLLCQDWPGFGALKREHYLAAADVPDDANVSGLVAFFFACFGSATPDADQFLMNLSQAATAPPWPRSRSSPRCRAGCWPTPRAAPWPSSATSTAPGAFPSSRPS